MSSTPTPASTERWSRLFAAKEEAVKAEQRGVFWIFIPTTDQITKSFDQYQANHLLRSGFDAVPPSTTEGER